MRSVHDLKPDGPPSRPQPRARFGPTGRSLQLLVWLAGLLVLVLMLQQWLSGVGIVRPFGA